VTRLHVALCLAVVLAAACGSRVPPVVIELQAPAEITAGCLFEVAWTGPDSTGDYITIVPAGAPEGDWTDYAYTSDANPVTLTAPLAPGSYEIRYATERTNPDSTLGRITVTVAPVTAGVVAPAEVAGGSPFDVSWSGPDGSGIYVVLVPAGTAEGEWQGYEWHYVYEGNPIAFTAPAAAGAYELRMVTESTIVDSTLARAVLNVSGTEIALTAPSAISTGQDFQVSWVGPDNTGDYITIVASGSPEGDWAEYAYTSEGNPVTLTAPAEVGEYEIRYANETPNPDITLGRIIINIQ
jgi:Ca-activated chloride channel homolog